MSSQKGGNKAVRPVGSTASDVVLDELKDLSANTVILWTKYEDVAIHFNDLIMRWRLQAIGGLAALVTVAGFVVGEAATASVRYRGMLLLSVTFIFAWVGVAVVDLVYYRKLLAGAVDAILELEAKAPSLRLSTIIEKFARTGGRVAPGVFYALGLSPLVIIAGWALWSLCQIPPTTRPAIGALALDSGRIVNVKASGARTWNAALQTFTLRQIDLRVIEQESGRLVSDTIGIQPAATPGDYADCWDDDSESIPASTGIAAVVIRGDTASTVEMTIRWLRPPGAVGCRSTGRLENEILNDINVRAQRHL